MFVSLLVVYSCAVCGFTFSPPQPEPLKLALIIHVSVWWGGEVKAYLSNPLSQDGAMKNHSLTTLPFKAFSLKESTDRNNTANEYKTTKVAAVTTFFSFFFISACRCSCPGLAEGWRAAGLATGLRQMKVLVVLACVQERLILYLCNG